MNEFAKPSFVIAVLMLIGAAVLCGLLLISEAMAAGASK